MRFESSMSLTAVALTPALSQGEREK